MKARKGNTLVFIYNSFKDPLFQNLVLSYIKTLSEKMDGDFHLITFEQPAYALTDDEKRRVKSELGQYHIYWHPLTFHTGRFLLFKKAWDFFRACVLMTYLRVRYRLNVLFCFANVSAAMGYIPSRMLRMQMIVYSYEPHAEFQREMGLWKASSIKYKMLRRLEERVGIHGDYILTGTRHMVTHLQEKGRTKNVFRAPTAVDEHQFHFDAKGREAVRRDWGVTAEQTVFSYLGKMGGLYYQQPIVELFAVLFRNNPRNFFRVATDFNHLEVKGWFATAGIPETNYLLTGFVPANSMAKELSAADMGVVAIPPAPFQRFRSPTKVAEYLLCGLPYIVCRGISEDDEIAKTAQVGIVVSDFSTEAIQACLPALDALLTEDKEALRVRCRETGLIYRSRDRVIGTLQEIYDSIAESRS